MRLGDGRLWFAPTDLANYLACRHKTALDLLVARRALAAPHWSDPLAALLRDRGAQHEADYLTRLRADGAAVVDLSSAREMAPDEACALTVDAMRAGADVIVQAPLSSPGWFGYADILRRVDKPSALGAWSYEVDDTKLSRETRGGTILQLCAYSELVGAVQARSPDEFRVVTPAATETYRLDEVSAFYRFVKAGLAQLVSRFATADRVQVEAAIYPNPTEHCEICRWRARCTARRRGDDHLSFVAGLGRMHQTELEQRGIGTLGAFGGAPLPTGFKPARGSAETYERLQHQARLQLQQRASGTPLHELLAIEAGFGLSLLPEPRPGDLFLDLEGDPFGRDAMAIRPGESGREYLFGLGHVDANGVFQYSGCWAFSDTEERAAFDAVMTDIMAALEADPGIHVYHYAPYEPAAFKRLMGRHATREADLDRLLRGGRFVDMYAIVRRALRAGVESYSIKDLEPLFQFSRAIDLDDAGTARRAVEVALETRESAAVTADVRQAVEAYNRDDCGSVLELQRWLERVRASRIAAGDDIPRPPLEPDHPSEQVSARQERIDALRARLLDGVPPERSARSNDAQARYLLAYLLDWHYREEKVTWWEYFRLRDLSDEELLDEPAAVAGLEFVETIEIVRGQNGRPTGSVVDRYRYPPQEVDLRPGSKLRLRDETRFGEVVAEDRLERTLDIKKGPSVAARHPSSAFTHEHVPQDALANALFRLGEQAASGGLTSIPRASLDLLLRQTGRVRPTAPPRGSRPVVEYAIAIAGDLDDTTLPIQGPPGSGKTYTGARMIVELVAQGKRVGVTATSHKVIRNLLDAVTSAALERSQRVRPGQRVGDESDEPGGVIEITGSGKEGNREALEALEQRTVDVLGGTAWLWADEQLTRAVDVLFIDEAGQMSLANALAVSQAARSVVLLGDPQQLEQPQKGSHPDGVDASALDHVLAGHKTMPDDLGLFLPVTWRLAPAICEFTSELFYERKLVARPGLERQQLLDAGVFSGAGLFLVEAAHSGCRNVSDDEVEIVARAVDHLLGAGVKWADVNGAIRAMTPRDILVVAPYNRQVNRLQERLATFAAGVQVGTVDKFQGREAPVVIYSMTTSSPDDAPRGMEFLYSLNRLNVATSRARCVSILVANPRLFEPDCRTPRQMQLANALCRYREMATTISASSAFASVPATRDRP